MEPPAVPPPDPPAALQLYTVRNALAADFPGTLERVRQLGFQAVETYPFPPGVTPAEAGRVLRSLGLRVVSMHCDLPLGPGLATALEYAGALNCPDVIWHGWPRPPEHDSIAGVLQLAARYNAAAAAIQAHGLRLGLHNHWWEFEALEGRLPCRILDRELDPEIFLEIDVYWAQTAGVQPDLLVRELAPRVRFLHLKDGPAIHGQPMTALGEGVLNLRAILDAAPHPVQRVVELDECATDVFEAAGRSLRHLDRLAQRAAP